MKLSPNLLPRKLKALEIRKSIKALSCLTYEVIAVKHELDMTDMIPALSLTT